jgi:hypothetical protein
MVSLAYRESDLGRSLDGYGYVIPRSEKRQALACTWTSTKFPHCVPRGYVLLRVFIGRTGQEDDLAWDEDSLLESARREIRSTLNILAEPVLKRVFIWDKAMPQYNLGHPARLERIRTGMEAFPSLALAPPLAGMGLSLEFVEGKGPVFHNPIRISADIDALATPPAKETLGSTLEAIRLVVDELESRRIPLIGFVGAPFTLASYAIEGGSSKDFARTKSLMYHQPEAWGGLRNKLVTVQADYLLEQAQVGAAALQIFDSWPGIE